MFNLAIILFLVSPIAFLAGLVNPKWVLRGEKRTRLKSSAVYSGAFVASFVIAGLTAPPQAKNASVPSPSASPSVASSPVIAPSVAASPQPPKLTTQTVKQVAPASSSTASRTLSEPSQQPQFKNVASLEPTNWSNELCAGGRYFPAKGASLAVWNSCQYINSNSLKAESIVLATAKDSENVADSMVGKGFQKVSWEDGFNPLTAQSTSACIVYSDKSVACHKGEGSNLSSNEVGQSTVETASSTSSASDEAILTANDPDSRINLRDTPSGTSKDLGYGLVGDRVQVIEQTTADGYTWHKVRFPRSGAVGWIRGDFVNVVSASQPSSESYSSSSSPTYTTPTYTASTVSTSGGSCNSFDDLDSRGHRCGGRASSVRSGGGRRRR